MTRGRLSVLIVVFLCGSSLLASSWELPESVKCQLCEIPKLTGTVEDCCCDIETVDHTNKVHFLPVMSDLVQRTFFKYFKVDLWRPCPFWGEDGQCANRACAVDECGAEEVPDELRKMDNECADTEVAPESPLGRVTTGATGDDKFSTWKQSENVWGVQSEKVGNPQYIDLTANPERFTGYDGPTARRLWTAVYDENCVTGPMDELCREQRVFYRLISGLQSSINTHIATDYLISEDPEVWGANEELYLYRVGTYEERLTNLYFVYLFVLRSIAKAKDALLAIDYDTGNAEDDALTRQLVDSLVSVNVPNILQGFDETTLFKVSKEELLAQPSCPTVFEGADDLAELHRLYFDSAQKKTRLREELLGQYRNMSRIMDCVYCERCRLWGKLQFLGLGTAVKILFNDGTESLTLARNEVVALINVFHRLSESVYAVGMFREMRVASNIKLWLTRFGLSLVALSVVLVWRRVRRSGDSGGTTGSADKTKEE